MKGPIRLCLSFTILSSFLCFHSGAATVPAFSESVTNAVLDDVPLPGLEHMPAAEWSANSGHTRTVRVSTPDQLIAAISSANASGQHTTIRVASGTYSFTQEFGSANGSSQLPPILGSIALIGTDPAKTILDGSGSSSRAFTVLQGAHLLVRDLTIQNFFHVCDY